MNISIQRLLEKMEAELASVQKENLREKVYSIKILCELILNEKQEKSEPIVPVTKKIVQQPTFSQPAFSQPMPINQPKKLHVDDEANGDSLFDF